VLRFRRIPQQDRKERALALNSDVKVSPEVLQDVEALLQKKHCRCEAFGTKKLYTKDDAGRYGTFITHLGILFTVLFFALGMALPRITDRTCYPGESIILEDGTQIYVEDFSIEDETGKLDYRSTVRLISPDGRDSGPVEVSVNHPAGTGSWKVYQQTYGTVGRVTVADSAGHTDAFYVENNDFLSADGKSGILIDGVYPGMVETENGVQLITNVTGHWPDPVYLFLVLENGTQSSMLAFPGDEITVAGYSYRFEAPVEYPGLRIKHSPAFIGPLLLMSVLVLTAGLYMTFMMVPVMVVIDEEGYCLVGNRPEGLRLALKALEKKEGQHA
ncbi:MAG: cytochrome c biogenesis protein ResB, partial [Solobacterium sp.]|nr:cytochrome c biogenesis protein ResB [Solobacterium sp.]